MTQNPTSSQKANEALHSIQNWIDDLHKMEGFEKPFKTDSRLANRVAESKEASLQLEARGRLRKTGDLSDFSRGHQAAGRRILSTTAELLGFSTNIATISRAHRGRSPKREISVSGGQGGGKWRERPRKTRLKWQE